MPVPKLKTLAIGILLLANGILAMIVFPGRMAVRQEEDALRQSLCRLYAQQEVELEPQTILDTTDLYVLELKEDALSDVQAAKALLGEQLLAQDDSTRYLSVYRSARGQCSISRSGEFTASLADADAVRNPQRATKKLLKSMGFDSLSLPEMQITGETCTLTATQTVLGMPVFSNGLTFTYEQGRLTELSGVFFTGTDTLRRVSDRVGISAADALVAFLDARDNLGWVGSSVTAMEQGYIRSETATAAVVRLTPAWQVETDTGVFRVHGLTGEVTPVE